MKAKNSKYPWLNAILFQGCWLICVLTPQHYAVACTLLFIAVHLASIYDVNEELLFALPLAFIGFAFDLCLNALGLIDIDPNGNKSLYLLCLWILFSFTLRWSMLAVLRSAPLSLLVGLLAPISYYAAQKFHKFSYLEPQIKAILIHSIFWALMMLFAHFKFKNLPLRKVDAK